MILETTKYFRKPFHVDAVQVTELNIAAVAEWCGGEVRQREEGAKYIKVDVKRALNDRQTQAFLGDWVLAAGSGFKVYVNKAFVKAFEQVSIETTMHETSPRAVDVVETAVIVETPVAPVTRVPVDGPVATKPVAAVPVFEEGL